MRYRPLGRTGQFVSEICLGTMTFHGGGGIWTTIGTSTRRPRPRSSARARKRASISSTRRMSIPKASRRCMLGQALRDLNVPREDVIVATKVRGRTGPGPNAVGLSRGHIMDQIAGSLKRLGLEHVDLYQIHGFDPVTPIEETLRALDDCVARGLVRTIGCSNLAAWQIMKALAISERRGFARFETVQAYYTIAGRELEREILPLVEDQGLGVMVWSPLAGGLLSGKFTRDGATANDARRTAFDFPPVDKERAYDIIDAMQPIAKAHDDSVARVALAWLLRRKGVMSVIIGAKTIEQLDDNLAAAELTLTRRGDRGARRGQRAEARISRLDDRAAGRGPRARSEDVRTSQEKGMRKLKWGVLGVAKIATEKVIPAMQRGEFCDIDAIASRDQASAREAARPARHPARLRLLRGAARRSRDRGDLQSAAERVACALDDQGARSRQARAVRKADRARRREARTLIAARDRVRQARRRSLHGALPSAMAARARDRRHPARSATWARSRRFFSYRLTGSGEHPQQAAGRRRPLRHRLLRDPHRALHLRRRADRGSSRRSTSIRNSAPIGWRARSWNFPAAGI